MTSNTKANGDVLDYGYDNAGNRTSLTVTPAAGTSDTTTAAPMDTRISQRREKEDFTVWFSLWREATMPGRGYTPDRATVP